MISHGNIWAVLLALMTVRVAEDGYFKVMFNYTTEIFAC